MMWFLFALVFLVGCQSVEIIEVIPEPPEPVIITIPEKPEKEPIQSTEFTLVKGFPDELVINGTTVRVELLDVENNVSRIKVNDVSFVLATEGTLVVEGVVWDVLETAENGVVIPRKSWVDVSIDGTRQRLSPGEAGANNVSVDFIGMQEGEAHARFVRNKQSSILAKKEEHYFDGAFIFVHEIIYFSADQHLKTDGVRVSAR